MLECVANVSEGRDGAVIQALANACGSALLDVHSDPDHHRSVFTLIGEHAGETGAAVRNLALAVADGVDLSGHTGAHPRFGALDVVPFVALGTTDQRGAVLAARDFGAWVAETLGAPVFLYADADPGARSLPVTRRDAFSARLPDFGPKTPEPRLGAIAVGARPPLVAVNVDLATHDVALARSIADDVRERGGGLLGVRALGFDLVSRRRAQVSMSLVDLAATGIEAACEAVRSRTDDAGVAIAAVDVVGLIPEAEYERTSAAFRQWSGIGADHTIEARLAARG